MVEKPAVYSKLFWIRRYGKSDSDTLVLIVINCSDVFAFNTSGFYASDFTGTHVLQVGS